MSLNSAPGKESNNQGERTRLVPAAITGYSNGRDGGRSSSPDVEVPPTSSVPIGNTPALIDNGSSNNDVGKAAVFGAMDGVLLGFAVVAGAAGGGLSPQAVLILGVSTVIAEGLSMGLGEYLSSKAMSEYIYQQRKREEWELTHNKEEGVTNLMELYMKGGMSRDDAEEVSRRLSKYQNFFVSAVMAGEIGSYATPIDEGASLCEGLVTFVSYAISGFLPLLMYALSPVIAYRRGGEAVSNGTLFLWACLLTTGVLLAIGIVKAKFVSRSGLTSAMETLVLGGCTAGLAYEIGAAMASLVQGL